MKKAATVLLATLLMLSLFSCASNQNSQDPSDTPSTVPSSSAPSAAPTDEPDETNEARGGGKRQRYGRLFNG